MKFLIDECLTPELTHLAHAAGYEAAHVARLGLGGTKDWDLIPHIVDEDWTLVTRNSFDFRGRPDRPGVPGLHATIALHAGLVCLNGQPSMKLDDQEEMFEIALGLLDADPDLVNQVLEITDTGGEAFVFRRYDLSAPGDAA